MTVPRSAALVTETKSTDDMKSTWHLSLTGKAQVELDIRRLAGTGLAKNGVGETLLAAGSGHPGNRAGQGQRRFQIPGGRAASSHSQIGLRLRSCPDAVQGCPGKRCQGGRDPEMGHRQQESDR